jgi:CelD/BcsL family acetyltransferase involved in cellulose biosynthesis
MSELAIRLVTRLSDLEGLREEWDVLSRPFGSPLLDHDWFACGARTLHDEQDLRIVVLSRDRHVTGLAPMVIDDGRRGRRLSLVGSATLYEPGGWLYASNQDLRDLAVAVAGLGMPVVVPRVARDSVMVAQISRNLRRHAVTMLRPAASSVGVVTEGGPGAYRARLSARTDRQIAGSLAKARTAYGSAEFNRTRPQPAAIEEVLHEFMDVEASGWKQRQGTALAAQPRLRDFFRAYLHRAAEQGRVVVSRLTLGATTTAMELAIEAYGRLWALKIAYDERFAVHSPGILLADSSIQWASEQGLVSYEFLGSAEAWQQRWHPVQRPLALIVIYPFHARALAQLLSDALSYAAGRMMEATSKQGQRVA